MTRQFHASRFRSILIYVAALGITAAVVSWYGVREGIESGSSAIAAETASVVPVGGPIVLPIVETDSPELPHRDVFMNDCVICHSPRLPLTQAALSEKQWTEVVHKMVAVYGAPVSKEDEGKIVAYLKAAQANREKK